VCPAARPSGLARAPAAPPPRRAALPGILPRMSTPPSPPRADRRPHPVTSPHGTREDPYYWMRDDTRTAPDVLGYLEAENRYTEAVLAPTAGLQEELFREIVGRIQEDDTSVPVLDHGYWYYARYSKGSQYPVHARKKGSLDAPEEILLDGNVLAAGHAYHRLSSYAVSLDGNLIAYLEDTVGRNLFTLRVKDLRSGELLPDTATGLAESLAWSNDGQTLFYVVRDPTTLRSCRVVRHRLGAPLEEDAVIHEEADEAFYTALSRLKSDRYVAIRMWSTVSTEVLLIDADRPEAAPVVFFPRERDHEYVIEHLVGRFVIRTNWEAKNFRLMEVAEAAHADRAAWRDLVPPRTDVLLGSFAAYERFIAVGERSGGLRKIRVLSPGREPFALRADEPTYAMLLHDTPMPDATAVRYQYSSLTTPSTVYELDVATGERTQLKREPVLGDFDPARYASAFVHATAPDGVKVPVSLVHRKDVPRDGSAPVLVYGYGSYGASMEPTFSSTRLSLLDRGWVFAIAHIRGGQELGRPWYEDGKLLRKRNTFDDFIAVSEHLVAERYAARDKVFAFGGSAGGLLMGAIANARPELYRGIVALVPFVDVVTTMLDESIPLTTNEFEEWGNPKEKPYYDYMLSYSPYDNVKPQAYPAMLVETGLWDSQVQYFEPAKWVARLRATRTDDTPLVFHVNMEAGHGGTSGRYERYRETARHYAFLLHTLAQPDPRRGGAAPG
jgi:oligopeptidase B